MATREISWQSVETITSWMEAQFFAALIDREINRNPPIFRKFLSLTPLEPPLAGMMATHRLMLLPANF